MVDVINDFVQQYAGSIWVLPIVFALCTIDGFFPPLPSESVVVALAAIGTAGGGPQLWTLGVVAALGAFTGDNIAYMIGRHGGVAKLNDSRSPRVRATMAWAHREMHRRAATIIVAARYVPVGRVAINVTAGAVRYPYPRFLILDTVAAISWAAYSVGIGVVAGQWTKDNPLLGAAIGVGLAIFLGWQLDRLLTRLGASPKTDSVAPGE